MNFTGSKELAPMSDNHIRAISATLSLLDEDLCEFDQWSKGQAVKSVLYEVRNTLTAEQRQVIARHVANMHALLEEIRDSLNLEGSVRVVDRMIAGSCAVHWASLADLEAKSLRRYGEVPTKLGEYLDGKIKALDKDLRVISDTVIRSQRR
jgi:hypothetical protein